MKLFNKIIRNKIKMYEKIDNTWVACHERECYPIDIKHINDVLSKYKTVKKEIYYT